MKADAAPPRIGKRGAILIAAALAASAPSTSLACGACIEDKVAATYDHGVVQRAAVTGDVMVFCEVTGSLDAQGLKRAVRWVRGVRPHSVRVSTQPPALSFALDPRARSPLDAVEAAQRTLVPGTRLVIVRVR